MNWAPALVLGEVPVEEDGSAAFYVPTNVSVYFQLLDENKMEIKRMRSFITFQPGEMRGCVGCHEQQAITPTNASTRAIMRAPSTPTPPPWGTERPIKFLTDVQPVLDRHCVECHSGLTPAAGFDFSGGLMPPGPMRTLHHHFNFDGLNRAYRTIVENHLVSYSNKHDPASAITQTRQFGSSQSPLIAAILTGHQGITDINIRPGDEDWYRLVTWIDANAQYHDRFVNSRPLRPTYDMPADMTLRNTILEVHQRRCAECHDPQSVTRLDWIDLRHPRQSLFLTAPFPGSSSAMGRAGAAAYVNHDDPDYIALRRLVEDAAHRAITFPRRDVEALMEKWWPGL